MTPRFIFAMIIGAGFSACSSYKIASYSTDRITVSSTASNARMDSLVMPYRSELALEMNRVIGAADTTMIVARPNSLMGQWASDVVLAYGKDSLIPVAERDLPVIALLNTGGLRASFPGGVITVGDVYKVMPFDNQVVALKLPVEKLTEMVAYIKTTGGEPIAGFRIVNGEVLLDSHCSDNRFFWIITTDFLANGGDKMYFLQLAVQKITTARLLRDLLLREVAAKQLIKVRPEERIQF